MEFEPAEEKIVEEEISKLPQNLSYLRILPIMAHKIFRETVFLADARTISGICEVFHKDPNKAVNQACNKRFWGSILLSETNKTLFDIIKYLKTHHAPSEIKDYYYKNFSLNLFFRRTYNFYVTFFPLKDEIIKENLKENPEINRALLQNKLSGWDKIIEKEDFILLSSPGIQKARLRQDKLLEFDFIEKYPKIGGPGAKIVTIPISNLKDSTNIHFDVKEKGTIMKFPDTPYRIIFFAIKPQYIKKDEFNNELVKSSNITILTDTGSINFLNEKKRTKIIKEEEEEQKKKKKKKKKKEIKTFQIPTEFKLGKNPITKEKENYKKGRFDTLKIKSKIFVQISPEGIHNLLPVTEFDGLKIPNLFTSIVIWDDIAKDILEIRETNWNNIERHFPEKPSSNNNLLKTNFNIKYTLGKSAISGDENATFAIILDKTSQKASIWNCDLNEFYCNHKHDLENLKNWIEFEKEKNDDICPNCCN